jgi:teichoic acid transport system permease protein
MHILKDLFKSKKLLLYLANNDFKTKYAGSYLGIIWAFIQPLVTILIYWFVFEKGLKSGGVRNVPFVLWLTAGLIPWFFFSEAVTNATNCFLEYSYLVKKVLFDIKILPIVKIISSLYVHVFFLLVLVLMFAFNGSFPGLIVVQLLYYSFCTMMLALSLVYFTSAIAIFFKDTTQIINIIMQVGVWLTPIMWNFQDREFSRGLQLLFKLNPMYYVVDGYRATLIDHIFFFENMKGTIYFWVVVLVLMIISRTVYFRLKPHFSDIL